MMRLLLLPLVLAAHRFRQMVVDVKLNSSDGKMHSDPMEYSPAFFADDGNCSYDKDEYPPYDRDELYRYDTDKSRQAVVEKYPIDPYWSHVKIEKKYGQRAEKVNFSRINNGAARLPRVTKTEAYNHTERPTRSVDRTKSSSYSKFLREDPEDIDPMIRHLVAAPIRRVSEVREPSKTLAPSKPRMKTLPPCSRRFGPPVRRALSVSPEDCEKAAIPDPE